MPVVFYFSRDAASANIAWALKNNFGFAENGAVECAGRSLLSWKKGETLLVELKTALIQADFLSDFSMGQQDVFIFASRHHSESGKPCFTVHAPGNWGEQTPFGGNPRELQLTSALAQDFFLEHLKGKELLVFREATHHGPTSLKVPSVFVEIGSTEKEWADERLALPVAEAIASVCEGWQNASKKAAVGFGGTHYCTSFAELPFAFSHVASKHVLDFVDAAMVKQAVEKTIEPVEKAFLDWKGCNKEQRGKLIAAFEQNGLKWERV